METIQGRYTRTMYDHGNGFKIIALTETSGREHTVVGMILGTEGDHLSITGESENNKKYGQQFKAKSVEFLRPTGAQGIIGFLDRIPNIGPVLATAIYDKFKEDTFEVLESAPELLSEVYGISKQSCDPIHEAYMEDKVHREVIVFLKEFDVTDNKIAKIMEKYGTNLQEIIKNKPYRMIEDIDGFGFKTVDAIALRMGVDKHSPERIWAAIHHALNQAQGVGHTFVPRESLVAVICKELRVPRAEVDDAIDNSGGFLTFRDEILKKGANKPCIYLTKLHSMEKSIAKELQVLAGEGELF